MLHHCQILIHHYEMTKTSGHYEYVEQFMASEVLKSVMKYRELHSVDDSANGVDDSTD